MFQRFVPVAAVVTMFLEQLVHHVTRSHEKHLLFLQLKRQIVCTRTLSRAVDIIIKLIIV